MRDNNRLYRAIRTDNGEWVYGSVIDQGPGKSYIIQNNLSDPIPIIWDTIGQYVPGLDAFEGDILCGSDNPNVNIWQGIVTYIPNLSRIMVVTEGLHYYEVSQFPRNYPKIDPSIHPSINPNIHQDAQQFRSVYISAEMVKYIMANRDVIISHETAALLLGLAKPKRQSTLHCYTNADYKIPGVVSHNVDSLQNIPYLNILGVRITNDSQTLRDLLAESTDKDILMSSLAYCKTNHPTYFADVINNLPQSLKDRYEELKDYLEAE